VQRRGALERVLRAVSRKINNDRIHERGQPTTPTFNCDHRTLCCDPAWSIPAASQTSKCRNLSTVPAHPGRLQRSTGRPEAHEVVRMARPPGPAGAPEPVRYTLVSNCSGNSRSDFRPDSAAVTSKVVVCFTSRSLMSSAMMVWAVMGSRPGRRRVVEHSGVPSPRRARWRRAFSCRRKARWGNFSSGANSTNSRAPRRAAGPARERTGWTSG